MELYHDHEMVRIVEYESLWDNLGMSDIMLFSIVITPNNKISLCILPMAECLGGGGGGDPDHFDILVIS